MIHHYELQPSVWHASTLIFDWDDEAGTVSGRDAGFIIGEAGTGSASCHPYVWFHKFGENPLKSKTDMAAIIGWEHKLPDDLKEFYPKLEDDGFPEKTYINDDGIMVIGRDMITH